MEIHGPSCEVFNRHEDVANQSGYDTAEQRHPQYKWHHFLQMRVGGQDGGDLHREGEEDNADRQVNEKNVKTADEI